MIKNRVPENQTEGGVVQEGGSESPESPPDSDPRGVGRGVCPPWKFPGLTWMEEVGGAARIRLEEKNSDYSCLYECENFTEPTQKSLDANKQNPFLRSCMKQLYMLKEVVASMMNKKTRPQLSLANKSFV